MSEESKKLIEEAEAEILNPRHSFDMVIPGEVRINPNLSWEEKIFYSLLRNLCRREGYCWATNDYLSKEMNVDPSTIKRWLSSLLEENLVEREIIIYQMKKRRRIWMKGTNLKKVIISSSTHPPSAHPCAHGRLAHEPYTEERYTKENNCLLSEGTDGQKISSIESKKEDALPSTEPIMDEKIAINTFRDGTEIRTHLDDIFREAIRKREKWGTDEIFQAFEILKSYKGIIGDPLRFIEGTIENLQREKKSDFLAKRRGNKACLRKGKQALDESNEKNSEDGTKERVLVGWDLKPII